MMNELEDKFPSLERVSEECDIAMRNLSNHEAYNLKYCDNIDDGYKLVVSMANYLENHKISDLLNLVYISVAEYESSMDKAKENMCDAIPDKSTLKDYVDFFKQAQSEEQLRDLYNAHIAMTPNLKKHALITKGANIVAKIKGWNKIKYIEK